MLQVYNAIPDGFLSITARQLYTILPQPSLIHLAGEKKNPLFLSILQHGNEDVGLRAVQHILRRYGDNLPRSVSIFVSNVQAARFGARRLDSQPDYNRVWPTQDQFPHDLPECEMARSVYFMMKEMRPFASIDLHNNTGLNPHYACINKLDNQFFHLASLFSRTAVYFLRPVGVQSLAFADLCPSVTIECGRTGDPRGVEHAAEFIDACLHLSSLPDHPVAHGDIDLYHTVATVKVPANLSFGFGSAQTDIRFIEDLDSYNFREVYAGTTLAYLGENQQVHFDVRDETGREVEKAYFKLEENEIRFAQTVMPSMLTLDERIIRQDCLCYLMERYPLG